MKRSINLNWQTRGVCCHSSVPCVLKTRGSCRNHSRGWGPCGPALGFSVIYTPLDVKFNKPWMSFQMSSSEWQILVPRRLKYSSTTALSFGMKKYRLCGNGPVISLTEPKLCSTVSTAYEQQNEHADQYIAVLFSKMRCWFSISALIPDEVC